MAGIQVMASTSGFLNTWLDTDRDTTWTGESDHVLKNVKINEGVQTVEFHVPEDAEQGMSFMRFRFCTVPNVWVKGLAVNGEVEDYRVSIGVTGVDQQSKVFPTKYILYQNYPNPFNPQTTVQFSIPSTGKQMVQAELHIYNIKGQLIRTLLNEKRCPGVYQVDWDGLDEAGRPVATGIYLYRFRAGAFAATKKLILIK